MAYDIEHATLADLGRFLAGRTGAHHMARIARSTAPQMRYDWVVSELVKNPTQCGYFSTEELTELVARIQDPGKHLAALDALYLAAI